MVDGHHLVQSVAVEVGHVQRVVTLSGIGTVFLAVLARSLVVGVEAPALCQDGRTILYTVVPGLNDGAVIDAAPDDDGWQSRLVEASHAHTEGAGPLPIVVAPDLAGLAGYEVVARQLTAGPAEL